MTPFFIIGFILILLFSLWAQWRVKSAFTQFSEVPVDSGLNGAQTAQRILQAAGINDVEITETESFLGEMGIIRQGSEAAGVNKVLDSAALTYVAAFVASLFQMIRLWLLTQSGRRA